MSGFMTVIVRHLEECAMLVNCVKIPAQLSSFKLFMPLMVCFSTLCHNLSLLFLNETRAFFADGMSWSLFDVCLRCQEFV